MLDALLDLLFPPMCVGCRSAGWPFCGSCWPEVALLGPPGCTGCGRPLAASVARCSECPPRAIGSSRAPFLYEGPVRDALMGLKFAGLRAVAQAMAPWMIRAAAGWSWPGEDGFVVTWVPLASRRRRSRGYDQARILASAVCAAGKWPARSLLERRVETAPQARRGGAERRGALAGAFAAVGPAPKRVLLVDDVLTTGATAAECARVLVSAGASEVRLLTAARSLRGPLPARCYNPARLQPGSVVARERRSR